MYYNYKQGRWLPSTQAQLTIQPTEQPLPGTIVTPATQANTPGSSVTPGGSLPSPQPTQPAGVPATPTATVHAANLASQRASAANLQRTMEAFLNSMNL